MADDMVMAVHKVTGILEAVPAHLIDLVPALEKASERQIKIAHNKLETEIYGAPLKSGEIPTEPTAAEAKASASTEGGTA